MLVPVDLARIAISENSQTQVVWLKEKDGPRSFPIIIGIFEAWAIERYLKGQSFVRPLTHDLLVGILAALKGELKKIVITDIKDGTFFAKLVIENGDGVVEVDSRPSDALALAMRLHAPIFAEEHVILSALQPEGLLSPENGVDRNAADIDESEIDDDFDYDDDEDEDDDAY